MTNTFHQRCQLALTNPVTLGAVALLLVNDWLLKPLWQSDWTTGKLSDLAWMVFFPPLLAFMLSLVARNNARAQRAAFLAAYVGLPVLYAAYNTYAPLHDWIMRGFMLLSGASAGSPLDPWDSLVILPALAAALWVWRNTSHSRESLRTRLHLYAVVIAALATVATSPIDNDDGDFGSLGLSNDGAVIFQFNFFSTYQSLDGGYSWEETEGSRLANINWGKPSVKTPRGTYSLDGQRINLLTVGGELRQVHIFPSYLHSSDKWMHQNSTGADVDVPISAPSPSMVFEPHSGNTLVSMSREGVLVGNTHEEWTRVQVGPFGPTDFSFAAKARLLFSFSYWLAALAISLSVLGGVLAWFAIPSVGSLSTPPKRETQTPKWASWSNLAIIFLVILTLLLQGIGEGVGRDLAFGLYFVLLFLIMALVLTHIWGLPTTSASRQATTLLVAFLGFALGVVALPVFSLGDVYIFFAMVGAALALSATILNPPSRRQHPTLAAAFVAMNVLLPLPFLLWLAGGLTLWLAALGAAALLTLTAFALYKHLVRQAEPQTPPPS